VIVDDHALCLIWHNEKFLEISTRTMGLVSFIDFAQFDTSNDSGFISDQCLYICSLLVAANLQKILDNQDARSLVFALVSMC